MTQVVHEGVGSLDVIAGILQTWDARACFLLRGSASYEHAEWRGRFERMIQGCHVKAFVCNTRVLTIQQAERAARAFAQFPCDVIVAVGGGTVLDTAKAVLALACDPSNALEYVRGEQSFRALNTPLVAVPTTGGSGSEATSTAVVYVGMKKYSLSQVALLPGVAVLDPSLTYGLPARVTATAGFDALAQAIESMWSVKSTNESRGYAREALKLAWDHLARAVQAPSHKDRAAMILAAHLAGKAINISQTTAPHALSYALTVRFGVAHGHAVGLTLPTLLSYNSQVTGEDVQDDRGVEHVRTQMEAVVTALGAASPAKARVHLENLLDAIGLERRLGRLGISAADCEMLAREVNEQRLANNPRLLSQHLLRDIFLELL